mgnify:CR=1 FL=1
MRAKTVAHSSAADDDTPAPKARTKVVDDLIDDEIPL